MTQPIHRSRLRFLLILAAACLFSLWLIDLATFLVIPPQAERVQKVIEIPPGSNLRTVTQQLADEGMIGQPTYFIIAAKLAGAERGIKPGEYAFHTRMRPLQILDHLTKGAVYQYEIVIPEGYTVRQIGDLLERKKLADHQTFLGLVRDKEFISSLGIDSDSLEGYLFPSTYYIAKKTPTEDIIRGMVRAFWATYTPKFEKRAREMNLTTHEVVTIASIIEKETSNSSERPLVSAVFHNRLQRKIPLQSDPTVIYGLSEFDGNLKRVHLRTDSPYNTYRWRGLPPGPISNPGRASLEAALNPEAVDYLFFVSRNDGTHYFSHTLEEHNRAVDRFQKSRRGRK